MKISLSQMTQLESATKNYFETRVSAHLRKYFADDCAAYDDNSLRALVVKGIANANILQIHRARNVVIYIDIMLWLTSKIERRGRVPLIQNILTDPAIRSEDDRIEILLGYVLNQTNTY